MRLFLILFVTLFSQNVTGGDMLKVGDVAPEFELKDDQGKLHKLQDYAGKYVALYFYPKNDTPGCTAEACNLRDNFDALTDKGIVILGVSYDDQESHEKFKEKYNLPFTLLSDDDKKVAEMYGAKGGLTGFIGPKRITYLIGKDGRIMHVFEKVDTTNHAAQILEVLESQL